MKRKFFVASIALTMIAGFYHAAAFAESLALSFDGTLAPNLVTIEIPAPLETTRARVVGVRGQVTVDPADPFKTTGTIEADLSGIQGYSFEDAEKNKAQTEHMHNWFEIGGDITAEVREKNRWAKFAITKILKAEMIPNTSKFAVQAEGTFTLHGITKTKTVDLDITVDNTKTPVEIVTRKPFVVSLKEHDVKPRDTTGKFLSGALQVVGLKLSDEAQVSLDLKPVPTKK